MNLYPYLTLYTKINSKRIKDLTIRPKTIQLLEENTEEKPHDTGFDSDSLDVTPKAQATNANVDKLDYIKV